MATKNARLKRKCSRKVGYQSKNDARHAMDLHIVKHQPNRKVNTYKCRYCNRWHIGHNTKTVRLK